MPDAAPLDFDIQHQPDDVTCGPTCLHAIYRYFGDAVPFSDVLASVPTLEEGGTLGVMLARDALKRGYRVTVVTWNLQVFDPTWFVDADVDLTDRLRARAAKKRSSKLRFATLAYLDFALNGGLVRFADLDTHLLRSYLNRGIPILSGLSSTFLYGESRERADGTPDDVAGDPAGHFTVLTGYDGKKREVYVTDPLHPNPLSKIHTYPVKLSRLVGAVYLGVLTYDANLVVIEPPSAGN
jgi:hypothetical protein